MKIPNHQAASEDHKGPESQDDFADEENEHHQTERSLTNPIKIVPLAASVQHENVLVAATPAKEDKLLRENYEVHTLQDDLWCFVMYLRMKANIQTKLEEQ